MAVSTTKKSPATARTTKARSPAKPASPAPKRPATPKVVSKSKPAVSQPDLRKRDLIDLVVARSGIKKKDAKPVVEAMLAVLGETIASGQELNLQPLGKLRINRVEEKSNARVIVCKLRQSASASAQAKDPLAAVPKSG